MTLEKTIGSKPDVTPVCTNESQNIITLVVCKINTKRSRGEECLLLYQYGHDFVNECDTRFTLLMENQTLLLHLTNLTPEDSGSFNCQCSIPDGTYSLHLNITVEGKHVLYFCPHTLAKFQLLIFHCVNIVQIRYHGSIKSIYRVIKVHSPLANVLT